MRVFAELDINDICVSIVKISEYIPVNNDEVVEIPEYDVSLIHKRYKDGAWEEGDPMYFYRPLSEPETATLQMQSDLEYLVCLKELGL